MLYRQVNRVFADEFDSVSSSGLYDELIKDRLLVPHKAADIAFALTADAHAVIVPDRLPFISYPYEWCFGELKDAALLTLAIQSRALERGFVLRDASAYNVQFADGRPVFMDTLSFERYRDGQPWIAYKQFCQHFLVPLLLMARRDIRFGLLLREYLDGIPLDFGSHMLPRRSWADVRTLLHVHMHARAQRKYSETRVSSAVGSRKLAKSALAALTDNLREAVEKLEWRPDGTQWANYVDFTNYSDAATQQKHEIIRRYLSAQAPATVWDIGANTGEYSRTAREVAPLVVSFDIDPAAVERNYRAVRERGETGLLPLLLDLTNPSPALGWAHSERMSLAERGPADTVMALALVHHMAIANNVPLSHVAAYLAQLGRNLIIEFVAKEDSQVERLLQNREDIFADYSKEGFERAFGEIFTIDACEQVGDSMRWLYSMTAREPRER
ncbi:MAG: SAM-dependent methyltransferase [Gemmatimonadaceae bacterium]